MAMYGVDVAKTRTDDLDRKMLSYVNEHKGVSFLDLGSGSGGQSRRLAEAGANVIAIDVQDYQADFIEAKGQAGFGNDELKFIVGDIRNINELLTGQKFTAASLQRTLHYLTHKEAKLFLNDLRQMVSDKLFISVSGLDTDIVAGYPCVDEPIEDRFCRLDKEEADKFFIHESICLYNMTEFVGLLVETGWEIEECWESAFGNFKAVCVPEVV